MSRIGSKPVKIPPEVEVKINGTKSRFGGQIVVVKGPKGELDEHLRPNIVVKIGDARVSFERKNNSKSSRSLHGLYRALVQNMVDGVQKEYEKELEMKGIGYRAAMEGKNLSLKVGYTEPVIVEIPEGIEAKVEENTKITVSGIDKELVGQVAAGIRGIRKPEPYKGKGIRYVGEHVRRKAGKAAKTEEGVGGAKTGG